MFKPGESDSRTSSDLTMNRPANQTGQLLRRFLLVVIFCVMTVLTWVALSWFATLHAEGRLLNEETIKMVFGAVVGLAVLVLIPVIIQTVRSTRRQVESGNGLLAAAGKILETGDTKFLTGDDFKGGFIDRLILLFTSERRPADPVEEDEFQGAPQDSSETAPAAIEAMHEEASERIQKFNQEMEELFPRWKQRIGAYEQRVEELERELSAKESENSELLKRQIELVRQHLDLAREKAGLDEADMPDLFGDDSTVSPIPDPVSISPRQAVAPADQAAEMVAAFRAETESLDEKEKIRAYEKRIAAMETELAGTDAENRELTWNQLQIMQDRLKELHTRKQSDVPGGTPPKQVAGFNTEVRRRAALRVAELNERLVAMYPDSGDRISAYEERLARIEAEMQSRDAGHRELLECQMEMARNYFKMMQGAPDLGVGAPATDSTLSQMFGLQFNLNPVQQEAARQVARLNEDLNRNNASTNEQIEVYRNRISELEQEVALKDHENQELYQAQLELVQYHLEHLEQTSTCDEPMDQPVHQLDENGQPVVRIPSYQRTVVAEELPRQIKALLERKPTALKIRRVTGAPREESSNGH